ncbi:unnamed protein product [Parnassius mnemosyne]|uniref:DDE Tnp4 domain-containing protein n=1 Tax=Parnassius mnemosyne TaxID=213953 RepID=A0AAV1LM44_9NEOP
MECVSLVCKQVALALVAQRAQWIKMPQSDVEQNHVIAGFYSVCGFRQLIRAIDCTHIRILKVSVNIGQYYINRKGYSSINVQVMSNANLEIMDKVTHWRGSIIFSESCIKQRIEQSEFKEYTKGRKVQPVTPQDPKHCRTMLWIVEAKVSVFTGLITKLVNTKLYIVALAILHNIAMHKKDLLEDAIEDDGNVPVTELENNSLRRNSVRAAFINENF